MEILSEDTTGFVMLSDVVPEIVQEIRYYSTFNFVGNRIDGYKQPCALVTIEAAKALKKVSDELKKFDYCLKIYDAYRPQKAVDNFVRWAADLKDTRMKKYFYPKVDKSNLFVEGYLGTRSGHSRGSTVDVTLYDIKNDKDVDMGGTFDYFGELSHSDYRGELTNQQINNRQFLRDMMIKQGFKPLSTEWWHFTLKDEPYPNTYFNFDNDVLH